MAKQNKPAIRFKGFTDAWEQRKLGEVFEEYSEKNHEELPPLTIIQGGGTIRRDESERSLQYDKSSLSNYKMVNKDDFIVHLRSFEGGLEKANSQGIISPAYHTFHGENVDSRFYYAYFRSKNFINKDLKPHVYGIRDGRSIDIEGMKTIKIPRTSYAEQKSIGDFLTTLDNLITLHQRKYDKLQILKKAMLEKMFPKNGSSVPEIRFKGFTDAWEQRKLGEIVEIKDSARIPNNEWSDIGVPYIRASDISSENLKGTLFISSERYEFYKNKTGAPMRGDVLFNGGGEIGKSIICNDSKPIYVQGGAVLYARTSASNELEASYLKTYYETSHSRKYIDAASAGGTMKHFTLKPAQEMPVYLPEAEEQKQIGDFYICIDHLITLHQRELEKLQNIKKSMLEKMFV